MQTLVCMKKTAILVFWNGNLPSELPGEHTYKRHMGLGCTGM